MAEAADSFSSDYGALRRQVVDAGLLESQRTYYWMKTIIGVGCLALAIAIPFLTTNVFVLLADAVFFGIASTQIALLAHDVGHRQAFRGRRTNAVARVFFGPGFLGISGAWWVVKHNAHHAAPNHLTKDPDTRIAILLFGEEQLSLRRARFRPLFAVQVFFFPLLLPFQSANMRLQSVTWLLATRQRGWWLEILGIGAYIAIYAFVLSQMGSWAVALGFVLVHHAVWGVYNSAVFATNHKGMPLVVPGEEMSFVRQQVVTARNVDGNWFTNLMYGGLNYQIEHHLFPSMPRNNLAKVSSMVRAHCAEAGIPYYSTSTGRSYFEVFRGLHRAGAGLRARGRLAAARD